MRLLLVLLFIVISLVTLDARGHSHRSFNKRAELDLSDPRTLGEFVIAQLLMFDKLACNQCFTGLPDYGASITHDGLWEAMELWNLSDLNIFLNDQLDEFLYTNGTVAYNITHNIEIPVTKTIGDTMGLFSLPYLNRALYYQRNPEPHYNNATDIKLAITTAEEYILKFPRHLPDGCPSRSYGWTGEVGKGDSFVWADDQYMGLTLLFRLAAMLSNETYLSTAAQWLTKFDAHLIDSSTSLYHHGYDDASGNSSCCKWSRANGWALFAHTEALLAFNKFPHNSYRDVLLTTYQQHAVALVNYISDRGLWHQVIDAPETFYETSSSAMFLFSFIKGVENGWLPTSFHDIIQRAWMGIVSTIEPHTGKVTGICEGTGIKTSISDYESRSTNYKTSGPGLGAVVRSIVAMGSFKLQKDKLSSQR